MIKIDQKVKEIFRNGSKPAEWYITVMGTDTENEFEIGNSDLVKDSVRYDERMCSGDELKFGLCEGSSFEFQYFGKPNIKGRKLMVEVGVPIQVGQYVMISAISLGIFEVDQCPRQFDTGIMKVTAYNKLRSKYLDAEAKADITSLIEAGESGVTDNISLYTLLGSMLENYTIQRKAYDGIQEAYTGSKYYNVYSIPLCTQEGQSENAYMNVYTFGRTMTLTREEFYKFKIFGLNIKNNAKRVWNSFSDSYTKANGVVYRIDQFANTNYSDAQALCGGWNVDIRNASTGFKHSGKCETNFTTIDYTNASTFVVNVPAYVEWSTKANPDITQSIMMRIDQEFEKYWNNFDFADIFQLKVSDIEKQKLTKAEIDGIQNITLRDLQSAVFEINCQFGKLDRNTDLFSGVELNNARLYPSETLYPRDDLFPMSTSERANASIYQKLWTDDGSLKKYKYLIITYKGLDADGRAIDKTLQRTVNTDGNVNYNMSDNWLFRNLVWSEETVGAYADAMVDKMRDVSWIPFEMWSIGLPYLETGDEIEIKTKQGTAVSYILARQMTGIKSLMDTYTNGTLDIF